MPSTKSRSVGWDPWLIIAQIISMQAIHYLAMCILVPPLLNVFAEPKSLAYEGGAANVGMIMDWREMSSRATAKWAGGAPGATTREAHNGQVELVDARRGWCIAFAWMATSFVDIYYMYIFVRRPRLILDFALTLVVNHLILTTYYAGSVPGSVFYWVVMLGWTGMTTVVGEQMCVRRELRSGLRIEENISLPDRND